MEKTMENAVWCENHGKLYEVNGGFLMGSFEINEDNFQALLITRR
jgi:hypothetical protein